MIISKKKFNEAIKEAKKEIQERMWEERRRADFERETYQEIDRIRCDFGKHNFDVDERLARLEREVFGQPVSVDEKCSDSVKISFCPSQNSKG